MWKNSQCTMWPVQCGLGTLKSGKSGLGTAQSGHCLGSQVCVPMILFILYDGLLKRNNRHKQSHIRIRWWLRNMHTGQRAQPPIQTYTYTHRHTHRRTHVHIHAPTNNDDDRGRRYWFIDVGNLQKQRKKQCLGRERYKWHQNIVGTAECPAKGSSII